MSPQRIIYHIDMDAFFASIELIRHPHLKGKPLIVGGSARNRGVVSTCSYEARAFGVHSALSMSEAIKRCPHAVILPVDHDYYCEVSREVMRIFRNYCPYIQIVSIDEAYLDMTEIVKHNELASAIAQAIKHSVLKATSLTCSIGIAANKLVAKIASSTHKPNGLKQVLPGEEAAFLAPLPIGVIPGIGRKTEEQLKNKGYYLIQELQQAGMDALIDTFDLRGYNYYQLALGRDFRPVEWAERPPKSISVETTFSQDIDDMSSLQEVIDRQVDKAIKKLLEHRMRTRGITIKLRDSSFFTITRSKTFSLHTNNGGAIRSAARGLFEETIRRGSFIRLIGVSLDHLTDGYWQPTFWGL